MSAVAAQVIRERIPRLALVLGALALGSLLALAGASERGSDGAAATVATPGADAPAWTESLFTGGFDPLSHIFGAAAAGLLFAALLVGRARRRGSRLAILEQAIEGMADGFVVWDENDRLVICNEVYRDIYALSAPVLVPGTPFADIMRYGAERGQYPGAEGRIDEFVREMAAWHREGKGAIERRLPNDRWVLIRERRLARGSVVGIRTDITELKGVQAELAAATERARLAAASADERFEALQQRDGELRAQNTFFQAALNNMSHGLLMVSEGQRLTVANPRLADVLGIDASVLVPGLRMHDLAQHLRESDTLGSEALADLGREQSKLAKARAWGTFVVPAAKGRVIAVTQRPLDEGGWVAIYEDVTSQQKAESRVRFLAHHDDLTKLPNRAHFRSRLDERLTDVRRGGSPFALLYLDLDGFKDVNDTFGHQAGDALLQEVARRLRAVVAEGDFAARLGGDEFAVMRSDGVTSEALLATGDAIIAALSAPFDLPERRVLIGASVGIALARGAGAEELLRQADLALYQAKSTGRGRSCLFDPMLEQRRRNRALLEQDLRDALGRGAFSLDYQPIFDLKHDRVCGFEALVRWLHPERGLVSPAEFIPLAEEIGLIEEIGEWVLNEACREVARLPESIRIAVNLSAHQLRSDEVIEMVSAALRASDLAPGRLELEITETALLAEEGRSADILARLGALGVRIALDDFGTGYSSLSHLRNFALDKVKIDKSFVGEMTSNQGSAAIVAAVTDLARRLGMTTTAEGIETAEQLRAIRAAGCAEAQGFLLGRPRSILHAVETLHKPPPIELVRGRRRRSA